MNLFWSTRALTAAREDHLTEFFAAALDISKPFREAYANYILTVHSQSNTSDTPEIVNIKTQASFPGTTCCPDMILTLSNGKTIACEHKLEANETMGPEQDQRTQLKRYLDLPIDGLLYVRTSYKPPVPEVVNHPKYIRPHDRAHFLWRDFYPLLSSSCEKHILIDWLRVGFERLGFTPPHPSIGDMSGPDDALNKENRKNFAKLWQRTRSAAHTLGWKVSAGSIVELYLAGNSASLASEIFISPAKFERVLFRITPHDDKHPVLRDRLQQVTERMSPKTELVQHAISRKKGKVRVIDITTSLREILGAEPLSAEEIETKLFNFVEPLLLTLQK